MKTEYFENTCTRLGEDSESVMAWADGEKQIGLDSSLFLCSNGTVTQFVDLNEGEKFHDYVLSLSNDSFNELCEKFFKTIKEDIGNYEKLSNLHVILAVFDEIDNYREKFSEDILRRLKRVRESTESLPYKLKTKNGHKNFIIFENKLYLPQDAN